MDEEHGTSVGAHDLGKTNIKHDRAPERTRKSKALQHSQIVIIMTTVR